MFDNMITANMSLENKNGARLESWKFSQSNMNHKEGPLQEKAIESSKSTDDKGKLLVQQQVSKTNTFFNGSCYKWNKIGHRVLECRNGMNQNYNFFSSRCCACNKYYHKANQYRNPIIDQNRYNHFEGWFYTFKSFRHKETSIVQDKIQSILDAITTTNLDTWQGNVEEKRLKL